MLDLGRARAAWRRGYRSAARRRYVLRRRGASGGGGSLSIAPSSVWRFDEASGLVAADSVGPFPAQHRATNVTAGVPGRVSLAVAYNGVTGTDSATSTLNAAAYKFERTDAWSVSYWFQGTVPGELFVLFNSTSTVGWRVRHSSNGAVYVPALYLVNGANQLAVRRAGSTDGLIDGAWHHVAITYTGSVTPEGVSIYQDGVAFATTTVANTLTTQTIVNAADTLISGSGTFASATSTLDGSLDDLAIFEGVLTPDDVSLIYQAGIAGISVANL